MRHEFGGHVEKPRGERVVTAPAARHERRRGTAAPRSDALVVFGFTGDLAQQEDLPRALRDGKRGTLDVPVIGVASSSLERRRGAAARARERRAAGGIDDAAAFDKLLSLVRYVSGDYKRGGDLRAR